MKRIPFLILSLVLAFALSACGSTAGQGDVNVTPTPEATVPAETPAASPESPETSQPTEDATDDAIRVLVAYFSATGNTRPLAQAISASLDADLYEIIPETPYTEADLNYNTDCRANREQNDDSARPAISEAMENMEDYDTVFLGYPIWWGQAPKIMYTFLESYDMSGKTIVPFCTSGSSGIGSSATNLKDAASSATWLDGRRFSSGTSQSTVKNWVDGLGLTLSN